MDSGWTLYDSCYLVGIPTSFVTAPIGSFANAVTTDGPTMAFGRRRTWGDRKENTTAIIRIVLDDDRVRAQSSTTSAGTRPDAMVNPRSRDPA